MRPAINIGGEIVSDKKREYPWPSKAQRPNQQSISEIIQNNMANGSDSSDRVDLRDLLVQRTMARHGFTEGQALALILAFGGVECNEPSPPTPV
jgi:hypothetical protein